MVSLVDHVMLRIVPARVNASYAQTLQRRTGTSQVYFANPKHNCDSLVETPTAIVELMSLFNLFTPVQLTRWTEGFKHNQTLFDQTFDKTRNPFKYLLTTLRILVNNNWQIESLQHHVA